MTQIIPTAEPFLLLGEASKPACLLVHGFTGAPKEMRWLGEFLNGHGYTCLGVRLTGHATLPEDMIRSNYTDWTASVEATTLFLGGWQGPLLPPIVWFTLKTFAIVFFFIWVRGTFPRFRFDQLLQLGWKVLLPLALGNIVVTGVVMLYLA